MKTLTLRLDNYTSGLLPELQNITNEKTASKAIVKMIESYNDLMQNEQQMKIYINSLQQKNDELTQTLKQFESASRFVVDRLSQNPLF